MSSKYFFLKKRSNFQSMVEVTPLGKHNELHIFIQAIKHAMFNWLSTVNLKCHLSANMISGGISSSATLMFFPFPGSNQWLRLSLNWRCLLWRSSKGGLCYNSSSWWSWTGDNCDASWQHTWFSKTGLWPKWLNPMYCYFCHVYPCKLVAFSPPHSVCSLFCCVRAGMYHIFAQ